MILPQRRGDAEVGECLGRASWFRKLLGSLYNLVFSALGAYTVMTMYG